MHIKFDHSNRYHQASSPKSDGLLQWFVTFAHMPEAQKEGQDYALQNRS